MQTWIFQGNPDEYDIDAYLASRPSQLIWLAIARLRASHRCEIVNCAHPAFETSERIQSPKFTTFPLAEGGEDSIDNVACLCPAHHREVHLGIRSQELTAHLVELRMRGNERT